MLNLFAHTRPAQVRMLYKHMLSTSVAMLLVNLTLYIAATGRVDFGILLTWVSASTLFVLVRAGLGVAFRYRPPGEDTMARWLALSFWTMVPVSIVFGLAPLVLLPPGMSELSVVVSALIIGTAAGGVSANAAHRPTAITLVILTLGPMAIRAFSNDTMPVLFGAMVVVLAAILIRVSVTMERFLTRSLQLQEEKDAVIVRQRKAEADLRRSEEDFRRLAENSIQGVLLVGGTRRPLYCNDQFVRIFGYDSKDDVLSLASVDPLIAPHERERIATIRDSFRQSSQPSLRLEFEGLRKGGSAITLECMAGLVHWQGQPAAYITVYDISEQKRAEERLHEAIRMDAVGRLTGGIAHDFNNLLGVIVGNAELLALQMDERDRSVEVILRAADRGAELTQQLLSFSRRQPLMPEPLDCRALLTRLRDSAGPTLGPGVGIDLECAAGVWDALADPVQAEAALAALVENADEAMPAGGNVTISCGNTVLDDEFAASHPEVMSGDYVSLAVSDTGTGMSEQVQAQAFEPFFTTKGVGEGSGLGLSMVYGFTKQSGGHVEIESTAGQGTTVRLYLPRFHEAETRVAANDG